MTIAEITKEINRVKPVSRRQVFRYLSDFEIKPITNKVRPYVYPENSVTLILEELGLGIVTLKRLRAERRRAQKARAA